MKRGIIMNIKKTLAGIASYALVGAVALGVGGTLATQEEVETKINVLTSGNVDIVQNEYQRDENGEFVEFVQFKPFMPAMGNTAWEEYTDPNYKFFSSDFLNAQDKIVTVKNVGENDAYIRTVFAFECADMNWEEFDKYIGINITDWNDSNNRTCQWEFNWVSQKAVEIQGVNYMLAVADYVGTNGDGKATYLPIGKETAPSLREVYLASSATNEVVSKFGNTYDILVATQAVQVGEATADQAWTYAFGGKISDTNHPWVDGTNAPVTVEKSDEFKNAITSDQNQIVITLENDVVYDAAAWQKNALGGASTESIIINGNGHTITFNNTDSDWDNVATSNNAKLIINNAVLDNSGYGATDAPWNRHDINFACEVELNDVVSNNAIALKNHAVLNNVTIYDDHTGDSYALWIQAKGLTVEMDNCVIDSTGAGNGRGIKIDEQYLDDAVAKNTLVVKNTKFVTEGKAAILVKSKAGADITLENIDISGVKADNTNPVWVDENAQAYADLVTVTGGSKIVEP